MFADNFECNGSFQNFFLFKRNENCFSSANSSRTNNFFFEMIPQKINFYFSLPKAEVKEFFFRFILAVDIKLTMTLAQGSRRNYESCNGFESKRERLKLS